MLFPAKSCIVTSLWSGGYGVSYFCSWLQLYMFSYGWLGDKCRISIFPLKDNEFAWQEFGIRSYFIQRGIHPIPHSPLPQPQVTLDNIVFCCTELNANCKLPYVKYTTQQTIVLNYTLSRKMTYSWKKTWSSSV